MPIEPIAPTAPSPAVGRPATNDLLTHLALATVDAAAAIEPVRQAGDEVPVEPKNVLPGDLALKVAFFRGPNGKLVEFFQTR